MGTTAVGAILEASGQPLRVVELDLLPPGPGEVQVRIEASGICHSDLSVATGVLPAFVPIVLGHEGVGVVEQVGDDADGFAVGDTVVLCCTTQCGHCASCRRGRRTLCETHSMNVTLGLLPDGTTRFSHDGHAVQQFMGQGTFASRAVVSTRSIAKVATDLPAPQLALLGCAVLTGLGAALRTAPVTRGDTVAVIGCGGVGLNIVQGARLAGASRIVAIDTVPAKLDLARRMGATDTVNAADGDPVKQLRALLHGGGASPSGADVAFDAVGRPATQTQALRMTRPGGTTTLVGIPGLEDRLELRTATDVVLSERTIKGCALGGALLPDDIDRYVAWATDGDLLLAPLVTRTLALAEVNDALAALAAGEVARSVILHEH